jgi:hypothetical protein
MIERKIFIMLGVFAFLQPFQSIADDFLPSDHQDTSPVDLVVPAQDITQPVVVQPFVTEFPSLPQNAQGIQPPSEGPAQQALVTRQNPHKNPTHPNRAHPPHPTVMTPQPQSMHTHGFQPGHLTHNPPPSFNFQPLDLLPTPNHPQSQMSTQLSYSQPYPQM